MNPKGEVHAMETPHGSYVPALGVRFLTRIDGGPEVLAIARRKVEEAHVSIELRQALALRDSPALIHAHHTTNNNVALNGGGRLIMTIEVVG
jgi:hypothetical protein